MNVLSVRSKSMWQKDRLSHWTYIADLEDSLPLFITSYWSHTRSAKCFRMNWWSSTWA